MLGGCWTQLQKCAELYLMCDEIRRPQSIKKNTCISCTGETAVKSIPYSVSVFFSDFSSEHRTKGLIVPQFHLELFCQLSLIGRRHEIVVSLEWSLRRLQLNMLYFFLVAKPFENGQYLDIYGITRDQAGEYECSAENDVSFPDVKKVKLVVNCKSCHLLSA